MYEKIAELETRAWEIAIAISLKVFRTGTLSDIMGLGFDRTKAARLNGFRIEIDKMEKIKKSLDQDGLDDLEELKGAISAAESEAVNLLLNGDRFDPDKKDPPAGILDVKHLLKQAKPEKYSKVGGSLDVIDGWLVWRGGEGFGLYFDEEEWRWGFGENK